MSIESNISLGSKETTSSTSPSGLKRRRTVAAVLTHYNASKDLLDAVQRLQHQTRVPDEIIVVDDGSFDRAAIDYFARSSMRHLPSRRTWPRVVELPRNVGVSYAMRAGLDAVTSDCVWFGSVNDVLDLDFFECVVGTMEDHGAKFGSAQGRFGHFVLGKLRPDVHTALRRGALICSHATVVDTQVAREHLRPEEKWHCDLGMHTAIALRNLSVAVHRPLTTIDTGRRSYSYVGERSPEHAAVLAKLAFRFQASPEVLGNLGWPMVKHLWAIRQLDSFEFWFWVRLAQRELGKRARAMLP